MNNPLSKLKAEALLLKLSSDEKAALHASLMRRINALPGTAAAPRMLKSPFYFAPQFAMSFAALLLVVLIGGGTAFAAKGALPGQALYAIKTNINEPVMGALAFSTQDKIDFDSQIVETRLEEAQTLASQNKLDASTTEALAANLDAHLSDRDALAATLPQGGEDADASDNDVLDSSIAAQGDVLAQLGAQAASGATRDNSETLASRVRIASAAPAGGSVHAALAMVPMQKTMPTVAPAAAHPTIMSVSINTGEGSAEATSSGAADTYIESVPQTPAATSSSDMRQQKNALALEAKATSSLASLAQAASSTSAQLSAAVAAKLASRLQKISSRIRDGENALAQADFDTASRDFTQALGQSVTLSTFIAAQQRFDSGILGNLLSNDNNSDSGDDGNN